MRHLLPGLAAVIASLILGIDATPAAAQAEAAERPLPPVEIVTPKDKKAAKTDKAAKEGVAKSPGKGGASQSIAVLVNDDPVTAYEIEQRRKTSGGGASAAAVRAYVGKNIRPRWEKLVKTSLNKEFQELIQKKGVQTKAEAVTLQKSFVKQKQEALIAQLKQEALASQPKGKKDEAIEALIDERLKMQEARRLNVIADDAEIDQAVAALAARNKMTPEQFAAAMKKDGGDIAAIRERYRAELSWRNVIRRKFGTQVSITDRDIDRVVSAAPAGAPETAYDLQRIVLPVSGDGDQSGVAARLQEADGLRGRFAGCKSAAELANAIPGAKLEKIGLKKPADIAEPTRSLLIEAKDEDILPPTMNPGGVEVWMVCGRQAAAVDQEKRSAAADQLRQNEFGMLAKRHLKDLREDAHIQYR